VLARLGEKLSRSLGERVVDKCELRADGAQLFGDTAC
jgi:hypothetical protein